MWPPCIALIHQHGGQNCKVADKVISPIDSIPPGFATNFTLNSESKQLIDQE